MTKTEIIETGNEINGTFQARECREFAVELSAALDNPILLKELAFMFGYRDINALREQGKAVIAWYRLGKQIYMDAWMDSVNER